MYSKGEHSAQWKITNSELRSLHEKFNKSVTDNQSSSSQFEFYNKEDLVLQYFCKQIQGYFNREDKTSVKFKRRWRVSASATLYFRRFYVHNTLRENDPRLMMISCIFLAAKLEEHYTSFVHLSDLFRIYGGYGDTEVMVAEIKLIESLKFELRVFHPLNCLNSILVDWKHSCGIASSSGEHLADSKRLSSLVVEWLQRAQEILADLQVTSAVLSYNPLSLAVCALLVTEAPLVEGDSLVSMSTHLTSKFEQVEGGKDAVLRLFVECEELREYVQMGGAELDLALLTDYMRQLRATNSWGKRLTVRNKSTASGSEQKDHMDTES